MAYTIHEVAKKTGISAHTIRFWAKNGLFPEIERDGAARVRYFSEKDLGWVAMVHCLRQCGLSLEAIKEYVFLCLKGDETLEQRLKIIEDGREEILKILDSYQKALEKLNYKVEFYQNEIKKRGKKSDIYNPMKKETAVKGYFNEYNGYENFDKNTANKIMK